MEHPFDITHENYLEAIKNPDFTPEKFNIKQILPHSYPFLFVDRVVKIDTENKHIAAIKNVTHNEQFFNGHFANFPIMPGVLITEALAQVATILAITTIMEINKDRCDVRFLSIDGARFRKPVIPGDRLYMNVSLIRQKRDIFKFEGRAYSESGLCATSEFTAACFYKKDA